MKHTVLTTSSESHVARGDYLMIASGSTAEVYRVETVQSAAQLVIGKPWWLPFARAWWCVRRWFRRSR